MRSPRSSSARRRRGGALSVARWGRDVDIDAAFTEVPQMVVVHAGAHLVHIRVVNSGAVRSVAVCKSAGQGLFCRKRAGPENA